MKGHFNKPISVIMTSLILILGTFALVLPYQEVEAGPTICDGNIVGGTTNGDLVVKSDTTCSINVHTVNGNVRVANDARFSCNESTINGNISARGTRGVLIDTCTVTGKVSVFSSTTFLVDTNSNFQGDLILRGNDQIFLFNTIIGGNAVCARNSVEFFDGSMTYLGTNKGCPV